MKKIFIFFLIPFFVFGASKNTERSEISNEVSLNSLVYEIILSEKKSILNTKRIELANLLYKNNNELLKNMGSLNGLKQRLFYLDWMTSPKPVELYSNMKLPKTFIYKTGDSIENFLDKGLIKSQGDFADYLKRINKLGCYIASVAFRIGKKFKNSKPTISKLKKEIQKEIQNDFYSFLKNGKNLSTIIDFNLPKEDKPSNCSVLNESPINLRNDSISMNHYNFSSGKGTSTSINLYGFIGQKVICSNGMGMDYLGNELKIYGENCYATIGQGEKVWCNSGKIFDIESETFCNRKITIRISNSSDSETISF